MCKEGTKDDLFNLKVSRMIGMIREEFTGIVRMLYSIFYSRLYTFINSTCVDGIWYLTVYYGQIQDKIFDFIMFCLKSLPQHKIGMILFLYLFIENRGFLPK